MRERKQAPPALAETPPLALRLWDDPSRWQRGNGLGCETYASVADWVAARREWEAAHRITIVDWFDLACRDALDDGGMEAMNAMFSAYLVDREDELGDPRELAS